MVAAVPIEVWLPLVTLIIGYAFSLLTESFRDKRQSRRDREARELDWKARQEAWRQEREDRQREYERGALTELQEALNEFIAVCGDAYGQRVAQLQQERWSLPEHIRQHYLEVERRVLTISSRISDRLVRDLVSQVRRRAGPLLLAQNFDRADDAFADIRSDGEEAHTRIGELIRGTLT